MRWFGLGMIIGIICIWTAMFGFALAAHAQTLCAPGDKFIARLGEKFKELAVVTGIAQGSRMMFFGNAETGTFTIILVNPEGYACMVMSGEGLETVAQAKKGMDM